jgi:hypothetical protein
MGFSGGGSNVLKNHKHDGRVVEDGGQLDFDSITQADLTAGDVVYSNGTALQRLAIGTPAQQIQVNAGATAPEYFTPAPAAGAAMTLIDTDTLGSDTTDFTITLSPAISSPDKIYVTYSGDFDDAQNFAVRVNGLTTSTYDVCGAQAGNPTGALTRTQLQNQTMAELLCNNLSSDESVWGDFTIWSDNNSAQIRGVSHAGSTGGYQDVSFCNTTAAQSSISSVTLHCDGNVRAGTVMSVYKLAG